MTSRLIVFLLTYICGRSIATENLGQLEQNQEDLTGRVDVLDQKIISRGEGICAWTV